MAGLRRPLGAAGLTAAALLLAGCLSAPPQVVALQPNRGSTSVPADAPVEVLFDRPIDPSSLASRFNVSPAIPGCDLTTVFAARSTDACWIRWVDRGPGGATGFELRHDGAVFAPSTRYTFDLAAGFRDTAGDRNALDHHWDITTAPAPRVVSVSPGAGSVGVPVDAPIAVGFSTAMDPPETAAAITLDPPVAGTRVVRNQNDRRRFVILPGQLLDPRITYRLRISTAARGEDRQTLAAPVSSSFTTGTALTAPHAVVLAGRRGEGATAVLLAGLGPAAGGEPNPVATLMTAPRCVSGCGALSEDQPLQTYEAAALAPGSRHVAVVVNPVGTGRAPRLLVLDTVFDRLIADTAGGSRPSWSPDGRLLAYIGSGGVMVLDTLTGATMQVAGGTELGGPPLWATPQTLVLNTQGPGGFAVQVLDLRLRARYALPGTAPGAVAVDVSPDGDELAMTALGSAFTVPISGARGAPMTLPPGITPIGFAGDSALLATSGPSARLTLLRLNLAGGAAITLPLDPPTFDLGSVSVAPGGRQLVVLGLDARGVAQAWVANADGSGLAPITRFLPGGLEARAVAFGR